MSLESLHKKRLSLKEKATIMKNYFHSWGVEVSTAEIYFHQLKNMEAELWSVQDSIILLVDECDIDAEEDVYSDISDEIDDVKLLLIRAVPGCQNVNCSMVLDQGCDTSVEVSCVQPSQECLMFVGARENDHVLVGSSDVFQPVSSGDVFQPISSGDVFQPISYGGNSKGSDSTGSTTPSSYAGGNPKGSGMIFKAPRGKLSGNLQKFLR
uniref:Uncharacterized protein n=1 Tax=Cacopsylla melanoneura TaxID=428564 RepID=A0A8D8XTC2_9HEMI